MITERTDLPNGIYNVEYIIKIDSKDLPEYVEKGYLGDYELQKHPYVEDVPIEMTFELEEGIITNVISATWPNGEECEGFDYETRLLLPFLEKSDRIEPIEKEQSFRRKTQYVMTLIYKQMEKDELEYLDKFIKLNTTTVIRKEDGLYCSECDGDIFSQLPFCENCDAEKTGKCNNSDAGYCDGADCDICGKGFKEGDEILCLTDCDEDGEFAVHLHIKCLKEKEIKEIHEKIHDEWVEREWIQK